MKLTRVVGILPLVFLTACGDGAGGALTSSITSGLNVVSGKINDAAEVIQASSKIVALSALKQKPLPLLAHSRSIASAGLDTVWLTTPGVHDLYDSTNTSLKGWFTQEFNPNFVNDNGAKVTFSGRIANSMDIICYMGYFGLPTDAATGLPTDGSHTATITSSTDIACGGDGSMADTSLTITVSSTTDTTLYDKSFSVDMGNACPFLFKLRINDSTINIATGEDQTCDSRDQASSAVVLYDRTNDILRFTYISQAFSNFPGGFEFYRGYYTGGADKAYILGISGGDSGAAIDNYVSYAVVGKPSAGGNAAVSVKVADQTIADGVYNGCIDAATLAVTSATDTLACTMTGTDVTNSFATTITNARAANSSVSDIYNITETQSVGFTDQTDMF